MALAPTINQSSTSEVFLALATVFDATGGDPFRFVNNNEEVVSRGQTYVPYPFSIELPIDDGEQIGQASLTIDNVDLAITRYLRATLEPPQFLFEIVLSSSPNIVERSVGYLTLSDVTYDSTSITGTLIPMHPLSMPAIDSVYSGVEFPDLVYA